MKTRIILFLPCLLSLNAMGQGTITRQKCETCGKVISQCQYKGKHPKPQQEPAKTVVKYCDICSKHISQCDYGGKHPVCQTCGKLKEKCEYNGSHPVCKTCGKLNDNCEYKGNHPVCKTCGKLEEACEYKGNHLRDPEVLLKHIMKDMVYVEGGMFTMGATSEQQSSGFNDKPIHRVTLSNYYIGKYEVTQSLWEAVMGNNPSKHKGNNHPVENVSWDDCQTFLRKLNEITGKSFRLPTEAEWEYAARGGKKSRDYKYSGSDNVDNVAWYNNNSGKMTHSVGTKAPNELGIYDMSGNVMEWCHDWYGMYSSSYQINPLGPSGGSNRVYRNSSWLLGGDQCRVSSRDFHAPSSYRSDLGLRLALSL